MRSRLRRNMRERLARENPHATRKKDEHYARCDVRAGRVLACDVVSEILEHAAVALEPSAPAFRIALDAGLQLLLYAAPVCPKHRVACVLARHFRHPLRK